MGKISDFMVSVAADPKHGYDQRHRNGDPDYDCSSLVIAAVKAAGYSVNADYTGNMYNGLLRAGFNDVTSKVNLKTGSGLKTDDILLTPDKHTAVYTGSGKITDARIAETGIKYAEKAGDQTGHEIETHAYYNYPWRYVLRKPDSDKEPHTASGILADLVLKANDVLKGKYGNGDERKKKLGDSYTVVQQMVNYAVRKSDR